MDRLFILSRGQKLLARLHLPPKPNIITPIIAKEKNILDLSTKKDVPQSFHCHDSRFGSVQRCHDVSR